MVHQNDDNSNMTSMNYIFKMRLLNQILDAYKSGNYAKAKELATTAYLIILNLLKSL